MPNKEEPHLPNQSEEHDDLEVHYQDRDVKVLGLVLAGIALLLSIALSFVIIGLLLNYLTTQDDSAVTGLNPPSEELVVQATPHLPPEPRLQVDEPADYEAIEGAWTQELGSYGWENRQPGVAHIPIEEAMRQVAESNLPARQDTEDDGLSDESLEVGDASSGTIIEDNR